MKYFLATVSVLFIGIGVGFGQQGSQRLRLAQSVYEQGRLHELPTVLDSTALLGLSKEDKVSAYKLLTLAHIYLEEPEDADKTMLKLLKTEHFFEPNQTVDPAEFLGLYRTFRTKPVFNVGLKLGLNGTQPLINSAYYVSNSAPGNGKNTFGIGFQIGVVFEKEILSNWKNKLFGKGRLMFAPEVMYTSRKFSYTNPSMFMNDSTGANESDIKASVKQVWIDVNPIIQLKLGKSKSFVPYFGFGPGISYLLSGPSTLVLTRSGGKGVVSGPDVDLTNSYNKIVPSLIGMAGIKYRFGSIFLTIEFRLQYGLSNPINGKTRTDKTGTFDYNFQLSDYRPLNAMTNIGFVFPYFNPVKLKRK